MRHSLPVHFAAAPRCFVRLLFFCGCNRSLKALQLLLWGREGSPRSLSATLTLQSCPPSARPCGRGVGWGPRGSICICSHSAILVDSRAPLSHLGVILEPWAAVLLGCLWVQMVTVSFFYIMFEECEGSTVHMEGNEAQIWAIRAAPPPFFTHQLHFYVSFECTFVRWTYSYGVSGDISVLTLLQGVR